MTTGCPSCLCISGQQSADRADMTPNNPFFYLKAQLRATRYVRDQPELKRRFEGVANEHTEIREA
jgi:hypothetical protein